MAEMLSRARFGDEVRNWKKKKFRKTTSLWNAYTVFVCYVNSGRMKGCDRASSSEEEIQKSKRQTGRFFLQDRVL